MIIVSLYYLLPGHILNYNLEGTVNIMTDEMSKINVSRVKVN